MKKQTLSFLILFLLALSVSAQEKARQIDEFENIPCDDYLARVDNLMIEVDKNPSSTAYVLIYEGAERSYDARKKKTVTVAPVKGTAAAKIRSMREYLKLRNFPQDRFVFIEAGFRDKLSVEFWLVPTGAEPPEPTPTLTEMKYGKGKPKGFCIGCCGD